MLLNNNGPNDTVVQPSGGNVVFRRQKQQETERHNNNSSKTKKGMKSGGAGGGTSSVRNSWSFTTELPMQHHVVPMVPAVKENIYVDPETLINANGDLKAVSRSRLRQRSVSNLNSAALAGTRERRDHSSSNRHPNGTMAKGVDYIRIHHPNPIRAALALNHQPTDLTTTILPSSNGTTATTNVVDLQIQDRSEYGNPDGSSAHSTAERESGVVGSTKTVEQTGLIHPVMDLYQAINQNQSNDYKLIQSYAIQPEMLDGSNGRDSQQQQQQQQPHPGQTSNPPMVRHGSGRGSATNTRGGGFPSSSSSSSAGSTGKTSAEVVHASGSRKPTAAGTPMPTTSTGPNAVKTEWTFLPSPTAATEPQHREINSKPEVCCAHIFPSIFCFVLFSLLSFFPLSTPFPRHTHLPSSLWPETLFFFKTQPTHTHREEKTKKNKEKTGENGSSQMVVRLPHKYKNTTDEITRAGKKKY